MEAGAKAVAVVERVVQLLKGSASSGERRSRLNVQSLEFRVQSLEFRVRSSEFRELSFYRDPADPSSPLL
jgi:hypothetical protein